jgi:hypothetical protein
MSGRRSGSGARAVLDATCSEADLMAAVIVLARLAGWSVYHPYDSRRSTAGYPDLTLVREGQLLFVECKREDGRLTQDQSDWLLRLSRVPGVVATVWRPSDWSSGEIERALQRRGGTEWQGVDIRARQRIRPK